MITYHQMTLADIFTETQEIFESDKPEFLKLLESTIDLCEIVSVSFRNHFYASTGRPREYSLTSFLWALIIQRIFSIPTDSLLLTFLEYSKSLREFCGFTKVPDASKITRFKQEFTDDLQLFFDHLVDLTEPILQEIDSEKDLHRCPGVIRGTAEWESTYKIRTSVERSINHIKDSFCLGSRKTQNAKTLHADLLLAGITQLITVVVADRLHKPEYFRSLKRLVA